MPGSSLCHYKDVRSAATKVLKGLTVYLTGLFIPFRPDLSLGIILKHVGWFLPDSYSTKTFSRLSSHSRAVTQYIQHGSDPGSWFHALLAFLWSKALRLTVICFSFSISLCIHICSPSIPFSTKNNHSQASTVRQWSHLQVSRYQTLWYICSLKTGHKLLFLSKGVEPSCVFYGPCEGHITSGRSRCPALL